MPACCRHPSCWSRAHEKFDSEYRLSDEETSVVLKMLLLRFAHWIRRERAAVAVERAALAVG